MIYLFFTAKLLKNIVLSPKKTIEDISSGNVQLSHAATIFFLSCVVPFIKSFYKTEQKINFFENETINALLAFYSKPQIQVIIVFISYLLLILLIRLLSRWMVKNTNNYNVSICLLSICGVGIFVNLFLLFCGAILPHTVIRIIWIASLIWTITLSIISIKNCQRTTTFKAVFIYLISIFPVIIISGFSGIAPALLWVTQP